MKFEENAYLLIVEHLLEHLIISMMYFSTIPDSIWFFLAFFLWFLFLVPFFCIFLASLCSFKIVYRTNETR